MTGRQQFNRSQRKAPKPTLVELDRVQQILAEVDFPAFKKFQYFAARAFADLYLHLGIALRVTVQEPCEDTFDVLRRARDFRTPRVSVAQQLCLLLDRARAIEKDPAARNHLLAFARQEQPSSRPGRKDAGRALARDR